MTSPLEEPNAEQRKLEQELQVPLERWSQSEQQQVQEAIDAVQEEDVERSRDMLQSLSSRQSGLPRAVVYWLAGAALLVLSWGFWEFSLSSGAGEAGGASGSSFLGETENGLLAPRGEVFEYDAFRWKHEAQLGESFRLEVFAGDGLEPVIEAAGIRGSSHQPDAQALGGLQGAIVWKLFLTDAGGQERLLGVQRASLKSR